MWQKCYEFLRNTDTVSDTEEEAFRKSQLIKREQVLPAIRSSHHVLSSSLLQQTSLRNCSLDIIHAQRCRPPLIREADSRQWCSLLSSINKPCRLLLLSLWFGCQRKAEGKSKESVALGFKEQLRCIVHTPIYFNAIIYVYFSTIASTHLTSSREILTKRFYRIRRS